MGTPVTSRQEVFLQQEEARAAIRIRNGMNFFNGWFLWRKVRGREFVIGNLVVKPGTRVGV